MGPRAPAWVLLGLLAACSTDYLGWPAAGSAQSALLLEVNADGNTLTAFAGAPVQLPPRDQTLDDDHALYLLYADAPLAELGLTLGEVLLAQPDLPSREPPNFDRAFALDLDAAQAGAWRELGDPHDPLRGLRFPTAVVACLLLGGCPSADGCKLPCTPSLPAAPEPPLAPEPPEPPAAPESVVFTPCPAGWSPVADDGPLGVTRCDPRPSPAVCSGATVEWLGTTGCSPIGPACPTGGERYAADLPSSGVVLYVDPTTLPGGDGSRSSPLSRLGDALAQAPAGATLALAADTFLESVQLARSDLSLIGACVERTVIRSTSVGQPAVTVSSPGVFITRLTVESAENGIALLGGGLRLEDVLLLGGTIGINMNSDLVAHHLVVRGSTMFGLWSNAGTIVISDSVLENLLGRQALSLGALTSSVTNVRISGTPNVDGVAAVFLSQGHTLLERVLVEDMPRGLAADVNTRLTARDLVFRNLMFEAVINSGAQVQLTRTVVDGAHLEGLRCTNDGRTLLSHVLFDHVMPFDGNGPTCLIAALGADVSGEHVAIGCGAGGALRIEPGSSGTWSDLWVADDEQIEEPDAVANIEVDAGRLSLDRVQIERAVPTAVLVLNAEAELNDLTITHPRGLGLAARNATLSVSRMWIDEHASSGPLFESVSAQVQDLRMDGGRGMSALGSRLELHRAAISGSNGTPIHVDVSPHLLLSDVSVRDGLALPEGGTPLGLLLGYVAEGRLERVAIQRVLGIGLEVARSQLVIDDLRIEDVLDMGEPSTGFRITDGAQVSGARWALAHIARGGLIIRSPQALVEVSDVLVSDALPGVSIVAQAAAELERVEVHSERGLAINLEDASSTGIFRDLHLVGPGACALQNDTGLGVFENAQAQLFGFLVEGQASFGLFSSPMGGLFLSDGEVKDSCIGLSLLIGDPVTLSQLDGVRLSQNRAALQFVQP